jgi:5-methylcytosine-specific restriction endonuclease McrA
MRARLLAHLSDRDLLSALSDAESRLHRNTAELLQHLGEVDARKIYLAAGYSSMHAWCVEERHYSEGAAYRRIRAARVARRFPAVLEAVACGRLHLTAVVLLKPRLNRETAQELVTAATHKSRTEIEHMLAARFPRRDVPTRVQAVAPAAGASPLTPASIEAPGSELTPASVETTCPELTPASVEGPDVEPTAALTPALTETTCPELTPASVIAAAGPLARAPYPKITPLSPERYALQVTISRELRERLNHARDLLRSRIPSAELADVLAHGVEALIAELEKQKFAATRAPRPPRGESKGRSIPAAVRRQVRERDGDRCAFVAESGRRCDARAFLEFDHVLPVALGGRSTFENLRLLCRAHNQYEAGKVFGEGFMNGIRERAGGAVGQAAMQL